MSGDASKRLSGTLSGNEIKFHLLTAIQHCVKNLIRDECSFRYWSHLKCSEF